MTAGARIDRAALLAILVATLALGAAYARDTPMWQAPDEPAHFNYVARVAVEPFDPPELTPDAYPQATLQRLTAERFPPGASVAELRYQDYQPPLYYYLASAAYRAADGLAARRLAAVRLTGVFLSVLTVALAYQAARAAVPGDEVLAVGVAGIVAFVPMRLAVSASASNDALAVLLTTAALVVAMRRAAGTLAALRFLLLGGLLCVAVLYAKVSAYPSLLLLAAGEAAHWWRAGRPGNRAGAVRALLRAVAPAAIGLAAVAPWFARNAWMYGGLDVLGTRAHDRIVIGQPRTAAWIADTGLLAYFNRYVVFTFESFWGVFGWMAVFLAPWMYALLAAAVGLAIAGLTLRALAPAGMAPAGVDRGGIAIAALCVGLSAGIYVAYNLTFVQHQGRYLFTAIAPIALLLCLGWRELAWVLGARLHARIGIVWVERLALYTAAAALAALAWVSLVRYVVPGLS